MLDLARVAEKPRLLFAVSATATGSRLGSADGRVARRFTTTDFTVPGLATELVRGLGNS
jgi:hypothetical protein